MINKKIDLELIGLDGNAFFIMGSFSKQAKKEGLEESEIKEVLDECKKGNYDHILQTIMKYIN